MHVLERRVRRGKYVRITPAHFVVAWNEAASVEEVAARFGASKKAMTTRAARLRKRGWGLKKFEAGFGAWDREELVEVCRENGRRRGSSLTPDRARWMRSRVRNPYRPTLEELRRGNAMRGTLRAVERIASGV